MKGAVLPGGRRIDWIERELSEPGFRQLWIKVKASSICGSDIRAIYREHLGVGPEAPVDRDGNNVVGGHEPCGEVVAVGGGCRIPVGARVVVYHITGCCVCTHCRQGYFISCTSPDRAAHGWQRDGGHAPYMLTQEEVCVLLPQPLTFTDGALAACGVGTAWEALAKANVSARDRVLVTGLGPVGLSVSLLAKRLGCEVVGVDYIKERCIMAEELGLVKRSLCTNGMEESEIFRSLQTEKLGFQVAIDCSGSERARLLALKGTCTWGRVVFVGEGGSISFPVSPLLIHEQKTLIGSWVTSIPRLEELLKRLASWELHPEVLVSHVFPLSQVDKAYKLADQGMCGKVAILYDEELQRMQEVLQIIKE